MSMFPICPIHSPKLALLWGTSDKFAICTCLYVKTSKDNGNTMEEAVNSNYTRDDNFSRQNTHRGNFYDYYQPSIYWNTAYEMNREASQTKTHCGCVDRRIEQQERNEEEAMRLNLNGNFLFADGKYSQALNSYTQAYHKSTEMEKYRVYSDNMNMTRLAIDNVQLIKRGDDCLFYKKNYLQAQHFYYQALNNSRTCAQRQICGTRLAIVQKEIIAERLASEGYDLFNRGKYNESHEKYIQAYHNSTITAEDCKKFQQQYCVATNIVSINPNLPIIPSENYIASRDRALIGIDAANLNSQGDNLYMEGKYKEAESKYRKAYDKSQITTQKNIYSKNREKTQTIMNTLKSLDKLWKDAWDAENDTENDRCKEAKATFQKVLDQSRDSLEMFPGNSKFEEYKTLALLKIDGNELFNQGIESQQTGITLLQEARELEQQQKYKQADMKFKEAKNCFEKALGKFESGRQRDKESTRFVSSIEIVQGQINEVTKSIEITEQLVLSAGLYDLNIEEKVIISNSHDPDVTGKHNKYSQHI